MFDVKDLCQVLEGRFVENMNRHKDLSWDEVKKRLDDKSLRVLNWMEETGGEPDVVSFDGKILFVDFSVESPKGRRSLCYDQAALDSRKNNKPEGSACGLCKEIGVELVDEELYEYLQSLGEFDLKTSSWLKTPLSLREKGGAVFGDRRYDRVFVYHNGAESYYAARGFRCVLEV